MASEVQKEGDSLRTAPPSPSLSLSSQDSLCLSAPAGMLEQGEDGDAANLAEDVPFVKRPASSSSLMRKVFDALASGNLDDLRARDFQGLRDGRGITPLLLAAWQGSTSTVSSVVDQVGDGCLGDETVAGMKCLHLAAERPRDSNSDASSSPAACMLAFLIDGFGKRPGFPSVDARDKQGFTPLHVACMCGDEAAARCLLRRGADVGAACQRGSTPLHWASGIGRCKLIKLLAGVYGASILQHATNGSTSLHWAAANGRQAAIKILLGTFCAQVDAKDEKGCTPSLLAALNGHIAAVQLLLDRFKAKISATDKKRSNLLHAACSMGHTELASILIDRYKMPLEDADRKGLTPLARAAQGNQVDVLRLLLNKHGARVDTLDGRKSNLLHVACDAGADGVAKLLLNEFGFEVDAKNVDGDTPALMAASKGHAGLLAVLVDDHGASLETADSRGAGPLHKACQRRHSGAASVLLESYGLPVDRADPTGATPLHVAARGGDASLVELLTGPAGRANPGLRDGDGNQPLHIAAAHGHLGVVKVMVEKAGADLGARDRSDKSALDVAVGKANTEVADYLRDVLPAQEQSGGGSVGQRAGFERVGRWMRLGRAAGFLQDLALENVYLLPVATLLELGRFPSHYDAVRKKHLVPAGAIPPQAQVLVVSHPWDSPGNPDPSGSQFLAVRRFLGHDREDAEEGRGRSDLPVGRFGYVWLSFSCTSSNRMKPTFKIHLHNVVTAWCLADHALVVPETITRASDGLSFTDLAGYVERGWCCVELLCLTHLGVPTTLHLAVDSGGVTARETGDRRPASATALPARRRSSCVFERLPHLVTVSAPGEPSPGGDRSREEPNVRPTSPVPVGKCISRAVMTASARLPRASALSAEKEVPNGMSDEDGSTGDTTACAESVARLLWSLEAEEFLDATAHLVAGILQRLDDEISRDKATAASRSGRSLARPVSTVPDDSKAGRLLARILNFGLVKQDVEDVAGGSLGAGEAIAAGILRELWQKLGNFSSVLEKLDAVNALLLTGAYFGSITGGVALSRGGSPKDDQAKRHQSSPSRPLRATASHPSLTGGGTMTTTIAPRVADCVPGCHVS